MVIKNIKNIKLLINNYKIHNLASFETPLIKTQKYF